MRVIWYRCGYGKIQILNLYPNLKTRTGLPTAETRGLKLVPSQSSALRFPFELMLSPVRLPWSTKPLSLRASSS